MKKFLTAVICILIVVALGIGAYAVYLNYPRKTEEFSLSDYSEMLKEFPSDEVLGPTETARDAMKKAKYVWSETYGKTFLNEKPYRTYWDEESQTWLVVGSWYGYFSGSSYIIIQKSDGKVLAVWHTKL